jgi:hypothetical protein
LTSGRLAELVVLAAFIGIAQDGKGLLNILETLFGTGVSRIDVRVMFARKSAIGFLDLRLRSLSLNP